MAGKNGAIAKHIKHNWVLYAGLVILEVIGYKTICGNTEIPDGFVDTLRDFTIALLTILIPFALAMLGNVLSVKSDEPNKDFHKLDLHVMIDSVFRLKTLLFAVLAAFASLLLMDDVSSIASFLNFNVWMFATGYIGWILMGCYQWVKGQVWDFRFKYLKNRIVSDESVEIWESIWNAKNITYENEVKLMTLYVRVVDEAVHDNPSQAQSLIGLLSTNIDARVEYHLIRMFSNVLKWHLISYRKGNENTTAAWEYDQAQSALQELIAKMHVRLSKSHQISKLYKEFKTHIDKNKEIHREYCGILIRLIFEQLIDSIEQIESSSNLWRGFPSDWKITHENLKISNEAHQLYEIFIPWAWDRFSHLGEYDKVLADVAKNLFPDIEPMTWSALLIAFFVDDIRNAVKTPLGFGGMGRVYSGMLSDDSDFHDLHEAEEKQYRENTYRIVRYLPKYSNVRKLEEDILVLEQMSQQADEYDELRRQRLLRILQEMLNLQRENHEH